MTGPSATGGTSGAGTLCTVPSVGPKVRVTEAWATTFPSWTALYVSGTLWLLVETSGSPAAARIAAGCSRAHGVSASRPCGPAVAAS